MRHRCPSCGSEYIRQVQLWRRKRWHWRCRDCNRRWSTEIPRLPG